MPWQQISLITDEDGAPQLADAFSDLGAVAVTYLDADDQPVYEPAPGETKIWRRTRVEALYPLEADLEAVKRALLDQFGPGPCQSLDQRRLADQVWERCWLEHYRPMLFAGRLWVCPSGQERREAGTVCLTLDPGLAFGTGTHPTTALCLEWLASHDLAGKTVIDYGAGSGILAIAAVLLGAKVAYALDIDPQALTATAANALKNQVHGQVICRAPEQLTAVSADLIIANILAQPLIGLSATLTGLLAAGGQLVLSGILKEQGEAVRAAYQGRIALTHSREQEGWLCLAGAAA